MRTDFHNLLTFHASVTNINRTLGKGSLLCHCLAKRRVAGKEPNRKEPGLVGWQVTEHEPPLLAKNANGILACIVCLGAGQWFPPRTQHSWGCISSSVSISGPLFSKQTLGYWSESKEGPWSWGCLSWGKRGSGFLLCSKTTWKGVVGRWGPDSSRRSLVTGQYEMASGCPREGSDGHQKTFFNKRMVKNWSGLLREVFESPSLEVFKKQLDVALSGDIHFENKVIYIYKCLNF